MGATKDKVKGHLNEAIGKAKRAVGDATDNPKLKAQGDVQEAKGDVQKAVGNYKATLKKSR